MSLRVECYAGYRGDQEPRALWFGERRLAVIELLDRWLHPEHRYYKVKVDDGRVLILRHDNRNDEWDVAALVGSMPPGHTSGHSNLFH